MQDVPEFRTEQAPALLLYGDHAPRMAALLRGRPGLMSRIMFAPRSALHAYGAFLHLAPQAMESTGEVAAMLEEHSPRELLLAALPGTPGQLYKALDRAGNQVRDSRFYERAGALSRGPLCGALLNAKVVDDDLLTSLQAMGDMDPAIVSLSALFPLSADLAGNLDTLVMFLRKHGALPEDGLRIPPGAGYPALCRRLLRALDRVKAPLPGFELSPPFRVVGSVGELREAGLRLNNCVCDARVRETASYWVRLAEGSAIFVTCDTPPLLAKVRQVGSGLWVLHQVSGPNNEAVDPGVRSFLVNALRSAGLHLLRQDPEAALRRIIGGLDTHGVQDDLSLLSEA